MVFHETEVILQSMQTLADLRARVIRLADLERQYDLDSCALRHLDGLSHRDASRILFGIGSWGWMCKFCGEEDVE